MLFARVAGSVVSTLKDGRLEGRKLLLVQPANARGEPEGKPCVAVDAVGAGEGELVLIVQGSSARQTGRTESTPVDCAIIGIVDQIEIGGRSVFSKAACAREG
jgi:microcompartment protein CcmK/EutM